jgi:hypothetical protein
LSDRQRFHVLFIAAAVKEEEEEEEEREPKGTLRIVAENQSLNFH